MFEPGDIKERQSYRMRDGRIWYVSAVTGFNGMACVQLESPDGKITTYQFMTEFLKNVVERV